MEIYLYMNMNIDAVIDSSNLDLNIELGGIREFV